MSFWTRLRARLGAKSSSALDDSAENFLRDLDASGLSIAGVNVTSQTALQHVAVMACTSILSEDVAKLPVAVYKRKKGGGKTLLEAHPLTKLLRRPNAWQTRFEFIEVMQAALVLRGNAYAVIVRDGYAKALQLVPIHPDRVSLWESPDGSWFYFVTRQGLHELAVLRDLPVMIPAEDMFHLRWMAGSNTLLGLSRIGLMREAIGLSMSQERMAASVAGSGARPGGVLQSDKKLSTEVIDRLKASWQKSQGGLRNAGSTAILEEGLKWQAMGMTLVDAEFMASRGFSLEDIARGFRIPRYKLGIGSDAAGPSLVQQDQDYLNNVLSAYCERWVAKLEQEFDIDGSDTFVDFDYAHFLKADITTRYNALRTGVVSMILTPNEAREAEGLAPVKGGDTLYQPTNVAPIGWTPPASGDKPAGPGSDQTGKPAAGGDGDAADTPADDAPSV